VTDDPALNFILERRDEFLRGVPVFFCGPNGLKAHRLEGYFPITGISESPDLTGTINLVRELHPEFEEIAVVSDRNPASMRIIETLDGFQSQMNNAVRFRILTNESFTALNAELQNLPKNTPVLFHAFLQDLCRLLQYPPSSVCE